MQCNQCNGTGQLPSAARRVDYETYQTGESWTTRPVVRNLGLHERCGRCGGTGQMKVTYVQDTCPHCRGFRRVWVETPGTYPSGMQKRAQVQCPVCNGTGSVQGERYSPDYS